MTHSLVILTSPLQATHAAQYIAHMNLDVDLCWVALVKSRLESDNNRTRSILQANGFRNIREFEPLLRAGSAPMTAEGKVHAAAIKDYDEFSSRRAFRLRVDQFFDGLELSFDRVIIGDYRPVSYRQFLSRVDLDKIECVLLDDGAVSQAVMAFRESKSNIKEVFRATPFKSKLIKADDPLKYVDPSHLTYFSIYNGRLADGDRIVRNSYYDNFLTGGTPTIRNEIWIVGCSHVENDIASETEYVKICMRARELAPDIRCAYFPHRREDQHKVRKIAFMIGADIRVTNGIEELIVASREVPSALVSFGSTVLDTASRMVGRMITCALVVPPPAYFAGPRREHIEAVIRANIRDNRHVVGLFADDPAAADRLTGRAVLLGESTTPALVPPASGGAMRDVAPEHLEGLVEAPSNDGSMLLLEIPRHGLHRFQIASVVVKQGEPAFIAFRIAGEGRSEIRLRVVSDANRSAYAECDLNLDASCSVETEKGGVVASAAVYVDEHRRAVVRTIISAAIEGRYLIQVINRPDATAKSSFMIGNPNIGMSIPPQLEHRGATIRLDVRQLHAVLQIACVKDSICVLRLILDDRSFDVVLYASDKHRKAPKAKHWRLLAYHPPQDSSLLAVSTPIVVERTEGGDLTLRTSIDSVQIALANPDASIEVGLLDPYTGERRIVDAVAGSRASDPSKCYRVAY